MTKTQPLSSLKDSLRPYPGAFDRLTRVMESAVKGSSKVLTSPLIGESTPDAILKQFDEQVGSKLHTSKFNKTLLDIEMSNRSKFGPRSIAKPWEDRRADLMASFAGRGALPDLPNGPGNEFLDAVIAENASRRIRPLSVEVASQYLLNHTSSGLPYMQRKSLVKGKAVTEYQRLLSESWPCVLYTRTQEGGKTRNVMGFAIADTLRETTIYRPLLAFQKALDCRAALRGPEDVSVGVTQVMDAARAHRQSLISIDFSAFDTSVSLELIARSFAYIAQMVQPAYRDLVYELYARFATVGVVTPDGIIEGPHGVPSGSTFTNEVDSLAQMIAAQLGREAHLCQVQGDDGLYRTHDPAGLLLRFEEAGLTVNYEKSMESDDECTYLQNLFSRFYFPSGIVGGIYSVYRALLRVIFLERWTDLDQMGISGEDFFAIRTIAILENCKHHPLFVDLVKFVAALDRNALSYTNAGLKAYIAGVRSRTAAGIAHQYSDAVHGINSFETVKLLATMS